MRSSDRDKYHYLLTHISPLHTSPVGVDSSVDPFRRDAEAGKPRPSWLDGNPFDVEPEIPFRVEIENLGSPDAPAYFRPFYTNPFYLMRADIDAFFQAQGVKSYRTYTAEFFWEGRPYPPARYIAFKLLGKENAARGLRDGSLNLFFLSETMELVVHESILPGLMVLEPTIVTQPLGSEYDDIARLADDVLDED